MGEEEAPAPKKGPPRNKGKSRAISEDVAASDDEYVSLVGSQSTATTSGSKRGVREKFDGVDVPEPKRKKVVDAGIDLGKYIFPEELEVDPGQVPKVKGQVSRCSSDKKRLSNRRLVLQAM
jgi:hypothetical protein